MILNRSAFVNLAPLSKDKPIVVTADVVWVIGFDGEEYEITVLEEDGGTHRIRDRRSFKSIEACESYGERTLKLVVLEKIIDHIKLTPYEKM